MSQDKKIIDGTIEEKKKMTWTPDQQRVIDLRDRSMLVSAAAGSGKTAVLVQRIISMITDGNHPMDVDELLVVTFTNAAAAEMRERVLAAIEDAVEKHPDDTHLLRQAALIHNAQITTVDSFCLHVVSDHFHRIDLEPGFRIADEGELTLMMEDVCDGVMEGFYEKKDPDFLKFADGYSGAKSDRAICNMILKLYRYSQSYPWPDEWLSTCAAQYDADSVEELEQKPWAADYLSYLHVRVADMAASYSEAYELTLQEDGPMAYEGVVKDDLRQLTALGECVHFSQWHEALSAFDFKRLPGGKQKNVSDEKKDFVKSARDDLKKFIGDLQAKDFSENPEMQLEILKSAKAAVEMLIRLTREFSAKFAAAKASKNILDFSDLEHFALRILVDEKTKEPTETAAEYRQKFREVMIDEYQDSNYVQEAILTAVSKLPEGGENLFMVGDVKQSIYRFRLARPELFVSKYETFSREDGKKQRIDLGKNFRSRGEVLDIVNDVFARIMGKDLGNVEYDEDAALYQGREFDEASGCEAECLMVDGAASGEDKKVTEGRVIAARIREMVENGELPGKTYGDVVVLTRSLEGWDRAFTTAFEEEGVPLIVSSRTGYFSASEVQTVLAFLRIIDNPCQDIPLASVMRSPMGGFSDEEMAGIRSVDGGVPFYECVKRAAGEVSPIHGLAGDVVENEPVQDDKGASELPDELLRKTGEFWSRLADFRSRVPYTPIHSLIQQIYDETGYRDYVTAMPAGTQRRANLDMLLEKAVAYEKTSYHGLFHFVRYIDRLMKYKVDYGEAETAGEQENAVRLMTIHKSKGLEFPVVFVAGMGKQFNRMDERDAMVFHPEYGVGLKYCDPKRRIRQDTLIRRIFSLEVRKENAGEELRILYVAMTRAKEKLVLVGQRPIRFPLKCCEMEPYLKLDFSTRMDADCYWDWVYPALCTYGKKYEVKLVVAEGILESKRKRQLGTVARREALINRLAMEGVGEAEALREIDGKFSWKYPYADSGLKQKVTVSEIKRQMRGEIREMLGEDEDGAELYPEQIPVPYVPKFVKKPDLAVGALRGTAVHRFMECLDFGTVPEFSGWRQAERFFLGFADKLLESGRMEESEIQMVNFYQIYRFTMSPVFGKMREGARRGLLVKEQPFVMSVSADRIKEGADPGEAVLVQGIIDAYWEEDGRITILDYKTDRVDAADELLHRYAIQLRYYAEALKRRFSDKSVEAALIYSFALDEVIQVKI